MFKSTKLFDGFSCCFRQWKAETTHCRFLHGYGVSFRVTFEGELDHRNWVWDFGGMKRAKTKIDGMSPKAWMDYMFDHTVIVAKDDPFLPAFEMLKDLNNALNLVNKIDTLNLEKDNLDNLLESIEKVGNNLENKYKEIIEEESDDNLDSEE